MASPASDEDYLREVERLSRQVIDEADQEGSLNFLQDDEADQTPLQQAINALARGLRFRHFEGDGCVDDL